MFLARQGDVLVLSANRDAKPAASVPRDHDRIVLAYGEVTGHAHAILDRGAELYTIPSSDDRFLRIMAASGVTLVHEEHDAITIPAGDYIVRIQREYTSADMPSLRVSD